MKQPIEKGKISSERECTLRGTFNHIHPKRLPAVFYRTEAGNEPLRGLLKAMTADEKRLIGEDIRTVEYGWPLGMPTCRPLGDGLHEVRTNLPGNRIARIFFYIDKNQRMILLHGMIKKTRATPEADLELARLNKKKHEKAPE